MKTKILFIATLVSLLSIVAVSQSRAAENAATPEAPQKHSAKKSAAVMANDSAEAGMLRNAYNILATGDHDYKGHRVRAMHAVKAAADLLGLNLGGDDKDRQPQPLSDAKLQEARNLIGQVLNSAVVKNQERVVKRLGEAVSQINVALSKR